MNLLKSYLNRTPPVVLGNKVLKRCFPLWSSKFLVGMKEGLLMKIGYVKPFSELLPYDSEVVMKITFCKGHFGPLPGSQWRTNFKPVNKAFLEYKLFIPADFDFVKGGKLPGLGGGKGNTGGKVPNGRDGWSVRFMFKQKGEICAYLYYPAMPDRFGEQFYLKSGYCRFVLSKDKWLKIGLEVQLNELGQENGFIRCYIDDELMLEKVGLLFRTTNNLKIDHLLFSTFFGGADSSWAPLRDSFLLFKDFEVEAV